MGAMLGPPSAYPARTSYASRYYARLRVLRQHQSMLYKAERSRLQTESGVRLGSLRLWCQCP